jgi:hypothetical protein
VYFLLTTLYVPKTASEGIRTAPSSYSSQRIERISPAAEHPRPFHGANLSLKKAENAVPVNRSPKQAMQPIKKLTEHGFPDKVTKSHPRST